MSEEKRVFCDYTVEQDIFVGNKEVLLGVDKKEHAGTPLHGLLLFL